MKAKMKKYLNIYVVAGFIGGFVFLYMLSFIFVINDVANGSSAQMKRAAMEKQKNLN